MLINPYVFGGGGGGGSPGAPWDSYESRFTGFSATSHVANIPATVAAGDLLLAIVVTPNGATSSGFSGWTQVVDNVGTSAVISVWWKISDGTEGGGTIAFTTSAARSPCAYVFRFLAGDFNPTNPVAAISHVSSTGTVNTITPPSLALPWGAIDSFVMAVAASTHTGIPTGYAYATYQTHIQSTGSGTSYSGLSTAGEMEGGGSTTPSAFTYSINRARTAITLGIRPPA